MMLFALVFITSIGCFLACKYSCLQDEMKDIFTFFLFLVVLLSIGLFLAKFCYLLFNSL